MTLAEFIQKLVALGASPPVIAVTVEYVTERDASRHESVTLDVKRQKSAMFGRNFELDGNPVRGSVTYSTTWRGNSESVAATAEQ